MNCKLLLFDLDGTLLRSEQNCLPFVERLKPDIMISSGGRPGNWQ